MQLTPDGLLLSASDLTNHLACDHLTAERRRIALGERAYPVSRIDPHAELIRERGMAHEQAQLERLSDVARGDCRDLSGDGPHGSVRELVDHAAVTREAMRDGARLIFQGTLLGDRWQGRPDFLRRRDAPGAPWGYVYEVLDTKRSRAVKPHMVHQLCLYTRLVGEAQGVELDHAAIILGNGREEAVRLGRYAALHRYACRRLEQVVDGAPRQWYPEPVDHCAICSFAAECDARRRADDHLSLVAGAHRDQRRKLEEAGIATLTSLALTPDPDVPGVTAARSGLLHHQARLQRNARTRSGPVRRHLPPEAEAGYARLPKPGPGDVYFDLEGDPYVGVDGGIEYLWGWSTADGYECIWAHDVEQERGALETFVDRVEARRAEFPDLRVYHYAPHEASTLRGLSVRYGTREAEIDNWLRGGVLVDLYAVVRQGLQVGEERYSLKTLEPHHGFTRTELTVREGGGSIIAYERWLETGDRAFLDAIREYNREDCESTASLHRWLYDRMRPEAEDEFQIRFAELEPPPVDATEPPKWLPAVEELIARLVDGLPESPGEDSVDQAERRLLAQLLLYHYRESKPEWWEWFDLKAKSPTELVDEPDAVGMLTLDSGVDPVPVKRSQDWVMRFPEQEVRLKPGSVVDPTASKKATNRLVRLGEGFLVLRRASGAPTAPALIPSGPIDGAPLRASLIALAESLLADDGGFAAARSILRRQPLPGLSAIGADVDTLADATRHPAGGHLAIQGPPGTGKTYAAAHMVVAALRAGKRVALTATSHAAVQNMLRAVEARARVTGHTFTGLYRGDAVAYVSPTGMVAVGNNEDAENADLDLIAGTPWLASREKLAERFDLLFIDEAGQMSLASALAAAGCARGVVLLGDPQQLPQVNRAAHPDGAGASALGHLIGRRDVIPPERGVLLDTTWRMHPEICGFISSLSYEGAVGAHSGCAHNRITSAGPLSGAGLRTIEVEHSGRVQESPEEAARIGELCEGLLADGEVTDREGVTRRLTPTDILVVAPYNLAVNRIARHVPDGVRVGTVDRFQGQEAPVVFFAMTSSSGDDVPRGIDFLFDRNRLNVAISRAQAMAVLVHSPRLLDVSCHTLAQMRLVDGVCRFVEAAA
ncbi:MAG: TM0106 family RecB-like putative nuclease [Thermoleophilia bacterium]